ncbi:MAG TPA: APC family permease [Afifellaceae bacterium]|nr:APC family permease [Afifellaceae bacterium]
MDEFDAGPPQPHLKRALSLPLLVFYGLGVTVGAGIFALIGEISGLAGDHAPLAFALAGVMAAMTAVSYARLARLHPVAAGEAAYASDGFGPFAGRLAGFGVVVTGVVSSAVITLAFANYLRLIVPLPASALVLALLTVLAIIAWGGVKQSVGLAALITLLEVGTLVVLVAFGLPHLADGEALARAVARPAGIAGWSPVLSGAIIAFFAFVGFEDIVNMAEETRAPEATLGPAIALTLAITTVLYIALALVAMAVPERLAVAQSEAPLATLFEALSGYPGTIIAAIAAIAMLNGILIQIVMASRVLYGMAKKRLAPRALARIDAARQTPVTAIILVAVIIAGLALFLPLLTLARFTSLLILAVFTLVNLSLWRIADITG